MNITTEWWGATLYPESDEEWAEMVKLFSNVKADRTDFYEANNVEECVFIENKRIEIVR